MSRRVQAVEARMKAAVDEARRAEAQVGDLERARDAAQAQATRGRARAHARRRAGGGHSARVPEE